MHSLGPQTGCKRVTQIVKPKSGDSLLFTRSLPGVPERCQLQARAARNKGDIKSWVTAGLEDIKNDQAPWSRLVN